MVERDMARAVNLVNDRMVRIGVVGTAGDVIERLEPLVAAGVQQRYRIFIENSHDHIGKVAQALTGHWPDGLGDIPAKHYTLRFEQYEAN